jgi:hypothetical protein
VEIRYERRLRTWAAGLLEMVGDTGSQDTGHRTRPLCRNDLFSGELDARTEGAGTTYRPGPGTRRIADAQCASRSKPRDSASTRDST